jgi:hypothetical protein
MKYFIGIATNNKVRNETPSANAIILKTLIWLIFIFLPSFPANIKSGNVPFKDSRPLFLLLLAIHYRLLFPATIYTPLLIRFYLQRTTLHRGTSRVPASRQIGSLQKLSGEIYRPHWSRWFGVTATVS